MIDAGLEWLIVIVAILVLFGSAKKVPELAKNIGRATGEFKRGQLEVEKELKEQMNPQAEVKTPNPVDYLSIAKTMGIDTTGKTTDQIKAEITEKINNGK
ncbi:MAG: Sec-independent protein translocase subunit TatA/TatB [Thermoplasmata archaeon]